LYAVSCCNINNYDEFELLYNNQKEQNCIMECYKLFVDFIKGKSIDINEIKPLISRIKKYKNTDKIILLLKWIFYILNEDKRENIAMDIKILKEVKLINPLFINVSKKIITEI